jgi:outer membrane biogenesis lipoprotein LolB
MRRINHFVIISHVILSFSGCRINSEAIYKVNKGQVEKTFGENTGLRYFIGKGNLKYSDGQRNMNMGIRTRSTMDSATWISFSLLGMEAFRAIIDSDSVRVLDRISKKYHAKSIDTLVNLIGSPVGYNQFEILLFGLPVNKDEYKGKNESLRMEFKAETDTVVHGVRLKSLRLLAHDGSELLTSEYGKHVKTSRIYLPRTVKFARSYSDSVRVEIEWTELDTVPRIEMPFHIPTGYERVR